MVTFPDEPPPVKPGPAVTPEIDPAAVIVTVPTPVEGERTMLEPATS
jgi:hypothetical protein